MSNKLLVKHGDEFIDVGGEPTPIDEMFGGTYNSSQTYTDGKIRFEPQNENTINSMSITFLNKREFLLQGSLSCPNITANNWFTIGYLRRNNTRISWDKTCETVGCDGNLNPALVRFNNSYNDFRCIITKTPVSSTLYINTVVRVKDDLY